MKKIAYFTVICLAAQSFSLFAKEYTQLFRYKDASGHNVVNNILPPEYANSGYDIISERGNVIETIPPKRTEAEIAKEKLDLIAQKIAAEATKKHLAQIAAEKRKNEVLLMSFSSEKDIEESKNRKLTAIEILENITKEHIQQLHKQLDEARTAASNAAQMGRSIPENVLKTIDESNRQIQENELFLTRKTEEKTRIITQFQDDLNRFKSLKINTSQPRPSSHSSNLD